MTDALEDYLHEHIPISASMGIGVLEADLDRVALTAPLAPNLNHRSTVFGGSLSSLAILAAWTLVHLRVVDAGITGRVVIQRGSMEYLRPIFGTFIATCESPDEAVWVRFFRTLRRRGQARIELSATVVSDGVAVSTYEGAYVAMSVASEDAPA